MLTHSLAALQKGAWLRTWKDRIDRAWMDKYGRDLDFDTMQGSTLAKSGSKRDSVSMDAKAVAVLSAAKMRCGGCGSKVDGHSSPLNVSIRSCSSVTMPLQRASASSACEILTLWPGIR